MNSSTEFRILGPVSVFRDGRELEIGFPKHRLVMAVLLVDAGHPVRTGLLMERLWGASPPATARSALYTYIAQLRTALGQLGIELAKRGNGYILEIDQGRVDMHRFRALLAEAKEAQTEERALELLTTALELYNGTPFDGLCSQWVDAMRVGLAAEWRAAFIRRNDIMLRRGRHTEIMSSLSEAVAAEPLDESLAGQLMLALHYSGLRAAALQRYHRVWNALAAELGIDPGRSLQHIYEMLLRDEPVEAVQALVR
jgi:DNA-binding SARP family transcriptional activator